MSELVSKLENTVQLIRELEKRYKNIIVPYSGGKDSTVVLDLCLKHVEESSIHVIYADTLVEIPLLHKHTLKVLNDVRKLSKRRGVNVNVHIVEPRPESTFWSLVIGKGYPAPNYRFRWCMDRLKLNPMRVKIERISSCDPKSILLLGIRRDESRKRRMSTKKWVNGYEAGITRMNIKGYAPLIYWSAEDVWDYLMNTKPEWGKSNRELVRIYELGGKDNINNVRFGCWVCTVVTKDTTLQNLAARNKICRALLEFKKWLKEFSANPKNRIFKGGVPRSLTLNARLEIYQGVKCLEEKIGVRLISSLEEKIIYTYLEKTAHRNSPSGSYFAASPGFSLMRSS